jgi:hypothetical protein
MLGVVSTADNSTFTPGTGYTARDVVPVEPSTKLITEDQIQTAAGSASASAMLAASSNWGSVLAAFKPASGGDGAGIPATICNYCRYTTKHGRQQRVYKYNRKPRLGIP